MFVSALLSIRSHPVPTLSFEMSYQSEAQCTWCKEVKPKDTCYNDQWYCSIDCAHEAGDRRFCLRVACGCTGFEIKRRQLREHRDEMRVMSNVINDMHLDVVLEDCLQEAGVPTRSHESLFHDPEDLGDYNPEMDECSDATDPEEEMRGEMTDHINFVEAATAIAEAQQFRLDYERRSMTLEDCRSNLDRNCLRFQ